MRICLINHSFPPQIGGGETHMYLLAKGFAMRGHDVTVVTDGNISGSEPDEGFTVERIRGFRRFEKGETSFRYILDDFYRVLCSNNFDVVHVHNFMPGLAYASIAPLVKTKKTVFTFHSTPVPEENKILGYYKNFNVEKSFAEFILRLPFYNTLVCPSRYYYDWALKLGVNKEKLKLVYHGIEEKNFSLNTDYNWRLMNGYPRDNFIVVCPARMIKRKGILDLVKAIKIINDPKIKLYIPTSVKNGSSNYLKIVSEYVKRKKLSGVVKIAVDEENLSTMPQVYANCDICVLPSHIESLGIVLLEAMAAGIPVIGSDTSGINEVIENEKNGLLAKPQNPKDLAEKITRLKANSTLSTKLKMGGKNSIRSKFSLSHQLESLEIIFNNTYEK